MKNEKLYQKDSSKLEKKPIKKRPYTTYNLLVYMLIPTVIMLVLTFLILKSSMYTKEESVIGYNEIGNIDYKVFLKENNYYQDKYLGKDMQYIASIIDTVNPSFTYELHSKEKLNYTYTYKVTADLIISDPNDNNKILYKRPSVIIKDVTDEVNAGSFRVDQDVNINYDEYNNYVNAFKKEYALSVNSRLVLTFNIDVVGKSPLLKEDFKKTSKLVIAIPMSEQTINIGIDTSDINNSGTLERNYISQIKKPIALGLGIVVGILSLALLYIVIYNFITNRSKKDIYKSTVKGILREYDRAIVSSKTTETIDEDKYNVIEVPRIEELLDAHDSTGKPILFSEDIENNISTFVIVSDEILYKYTVVKKELEEEEAKRIEAKNKALEEHLSNMLILGYFFKKKDEKEYIKEDVKEDELDDMFFKPNDEKKDEVEETLPSTEEVTEEHPVLDVEKDETNIPKIIGFVAPSIDDVRITPLPAVENDAIVPKEIVNEVKEVTEEHPRPSESEKIIFKEKANTDSKKTIIKEVQSSNAVKKTSKKQKNDYKYNHKKNYKKNYKKNKAHHNKSDEII